jgi:ribosomal protein L11 methyltransferase
VTEVEPGWEDRWREFHHAVRVGPLWIGPPWETSPPDAIAIVIDPGRAFGTGAHATTRLCLELLAELPRGALLDVGCGSGVLSVAAARLGFAPVVAVDVADAAVEATGENAVANGVELDVRLLDAAGGELPSTETAVANVDLATVERIAVRVDAQRLVLSGYLAADEPRLAGFTHAGRRELEGWAADLFERR